MTKTKVYYLQNKAIQKARFELERVGTFQKSTGLDEIREMAGQINLGIESISRLSLKQREVLIDKLKEKGAHVRNPHIYDSDLREEQALSLSKQPRKIALFRFPGESQLRMLDTLAARIHWRSEDGYLLFCYKTIKSPRPRNNREVTKIRAALMSMIEQQDGIQNPEARSQKGEEMEGAGANG